MRVLVACEFSGVVRDSFIALGHDAMSCDLLDTEVSGPHYMGDIFDIIGESWDLLIGHPPCTHLAVSGARWFKDKIQEQKDAIKFVERLWDANIPRIAIENPVGVLPTRSKLGKASQYVQPWQFGQGETKKTGLWLKNLPLLEATDIVEGREQRIWKMAPSPTRWKDRSRTYIGIAAAMASQWGHLSI